MIKVVNPSVELWEQDGYDLESIFKHVARCARVCYQSTPKNKDENAYDFLVRTIFKGHDFLGYSKINVNNQFERILAQNAYGDVDLTSLHLSCCEHATVHLKFPTFIPSAVDMCVNTYSHNKYSRINNHNGSSTHMAKGIVKAQTFKKEPIQNDLGNKGNINKKGKAKEIA